MADIISQDELIRTLRERFGDDPARWAFQCPNCKDIATGQDFREALKEHPWNRKNGRTPTASDYLGQACIGRVLGALEGPSKAWKGRGCDWAAFGLFAGPMFVETPEGKRIPSFRIAPDEASS